MNFVIMFSIVKHTFLFFLFTIICIQCSREDGVTLDFRVMNQNCSKYSHYHDIYMQTNYLSLLYGSKVRMKVLNINITNFYDSIISKNGKFSLVSIPEVNPPSYMNGYDTFVIKCIDTGFDEIIVSGYQGITESIPAVISLDEDENQINRCPIYIDIPYDMGMYYYFEENCIKWSIPDVGNTIILIKNKKPLRIGYTFIDKRFKPMLGKLGLKYWTTYPENIISISEYDLFENALQLTGKNEGEARITFNYFDTFTTEFTLKVKEQPVLHDFELFIREDYIFRKFVEKRIELRVHDAPLFEPLFYNTENHPVLFDSRISLLQIKSSDTNILTIETWKYNRSTNGFYIYGKSPGIAILTITWQDITKRYIVKVKK